MKKLQNTDPIIREVMDFCREALRTNPKDPDILLLRGIVFLTSNQPKNAVLDFTDVIEKVSLNERSYFLRSKAYYELEEFDNAKRDCIMAMREGDSESFNYSDTQISEMESENSDVKHVNDITNKELRDTLVLLAGKYSDSKAVRNLFNFHIGLPTAN